MKEKHRILVIVKCNASDGEAQDGGWEPENRQGVVILGGSGLTQLCFSLNTPNKRLLNYYWMASHLRGTT